MKKILGITAALLIGMSSVFAWTNFITFGGTVSSPTVAEPVDRDLDKVTFKTGGINIDYIGCFDSGLALMSKSTFGIGTTESNMSHNFDSYTGTFAISGTELIGVGYSVVNQDNIFVGLFGTLGFTSDAAFAISKENNNLNASVATLSGFLTGIDVTAVYTPHKVFSLYASLSVNAGMGYLEGATGEADIDALKDHIKNETKYEPGVSGEFECAVNPFVKILPSIGIAWRF